MQKDKIAALLMEALDYDMGPVPQSLLQEALALLNPEGPVLGFTDDVTGVPWKAVVILPGQRYGLLSESEGQRALVNSSGEALVEFWDCRYQHDFEHQAQFVTRYYSITLLALVSGGINLCGGQPDWKLCTKTFQEVRSWLIDL